MSEKKSDLRDRLIHGIYGLVHDEGEWPQLVGILDAMLAEDDDKRLSPGDADAFSSVLPHVERANLLLKKMAELDMQSAQVDSVIDRMPMGVVRITPDATILASNLRADDLLTHIRANRRDGRLSFSHAGYQQAFAKAVEEVASGASQAMPVRMGELNVWVARYGDATSTQLVVYLGHQTLTRNIRTDQLKVLYGLTEKEARLTALLCSGHASLEEAAEAMGVGIATARSHLKHVFAKTGAERQADLVKMVLVNPILTLQQRESEPASSAPRQNDTLLSRLPTGRTLSWAEYGDPKGSPVLFCHAITGCRLMLPADAVRLGKKRIRLIVPDRAGYGFSTPAEGKNCMQQWLEDMRYFLPHLGITRCCVVGHSAGGAHAMRLAAEFPERVGRLCLVSSIAPLQNKADVKDILPFNRMLISLARRNPVAARGLFRLAFQAAVKKPDGYFNLVLNSVPDLDREVLGNPALKRHLLACFNETTRQGIEHLITETMHIATDWHVDAADIRCPVCIWHGKEDRHAPFPLMHRFSGAFEERPETHWLEDAGHYMLFYRWEEIIERTARQALATAA